MEEISESVDPIKPSTSSDISDILCESLLSLFEYVDDVTKSFNNDDANNSDVREDIVDGRLRESDGLDLPQLKQNNGEGDIYCKSEEKSIKVDEDPHNLEENDLTVLYGEPDTDDFGNDSTIICKPIQRVTGIVPLDTNISSPGHETNDLDNNDKNEDKKRDCSILDTATYSTKSKQAVSPDQSDIGSSPLVYMDEAITDVQDKLLGSDNEAISDISDKPSDSECSDNELLVTYSEVFASDDTDADEELHNDDRTVIVIESSTDTTDTEKDETVVDTKSVENKIKENDSVIIVEETMQILSGGEQNEGTHVNTKDNLKQKKRYLSSKLDSEITPKRPKNIEVKTPDILSPIKNTPSLGKDGMLKGILEETPSIIFGKTYNNNDDNVGCVSSTPLPNNIVEKKNNVRKVFWKGYVDNEKETEHDDLLSLHYESDGESDANVKGINGNRRVICKNILTSKSENLQDLDILDNNISAINREKDDSKICDIRKTLTSASNVSIYDSSYFAENTTRTEGRFKNVTATISNIDLELDENLLLSEDVLGLEGDYEDDSPDEATLLADDHEQVLSETGNVSSYPFSRTVVLKTSNSFYGHEIKPEESELEKVKETSTSIETLEAKAKETETSSVRKVVNSSVINEVIEISSDSEGNELDKGNQEHIEETIEIVNKNKQIQKKKDDDKYTSDSEISKCSENTLPNTKSDGENKPTSLNEEKEELKDVSPHISVSGSRQNKTERSNVSPTSKTVSPSTDMKFITEDKENAVMEEVKRRWGCEGIPSQEINLTMATTYYDNQHDGQEVTALLEGEKISCLNFYEEELTTTHQSLKYCSAQQTRNKLRQQKQDLDNMKMLTLQAFEQNCYRRCRMLKRRHIDEFEHLQRRHQMEYHGLRYCNNMMPFVKQQQLVQLGINHGVQKQRLMQHQKFEFESLSQELQASLEEDKKQYEQEVAPVEMLILQVDSLDRTAETEKFGPSVTVSMKKRPCKENNYKTSIVNVCLPVVIAQALSHEEDIYNNFYKF